MDPCIDFCGQAQFLFHNTLREHVTSSGMNNSHIHIRVVSWPKHKPLANKNSHDEGLNLFHQVRGVTPVVLQNSSIIDPKLKGKNILLKLDRY